jgi:quercetin dioxygenase-like cupin family protein
VTRFTILRGGDLPAAQKLMARIRQAPRMRAGASHLGNSLTTRDRSIPALARALARRLAPRVEEQEARAFLPTTAGPLAAALPPGILRPEAVEEMWRQGATLVFQKVDAQLPGFARLARSFELATGQPAQVNLYAGAPGAPGLDWHRDPHDVLIIQLGGVKEFLVRPMPLRAGGAAAEAVTLHPGDALWLPRGLPHAAHNGGAGSLHASIGLLHLSPQGSALVRATGPDQPSASPGEFEAIEPEMLGATLDVLLAWRKLPPAEMRPGRARLRPDLLAVLLETDGRAFSINTGGGAVPLPASAESGLAAGHTPDDPSTLLALDAAGALGHDPAAADTLTLATRALAEAIHES